MSKVRVLGESMNWNSVFSRILTTDLSSIKITMAKPDSPMRIASPLLIPEPGLTSVEKDPLPRDLSITSPCDFITRAIDSALS